MNIVPKFLLQGDFEELTKLPLPWNQLSGKRIFITGGTGFIGNYLVHMFCCLNQQMSLNLSLGLLYRGSRPPFSNSCIHWIKGVITQNFVPKDFSPDIIIHAASPANQQAISMDPCGIINCNILATHYLLEYARKNKVLLLFFSSGEVYQHRPGRTPEIQANILAKNSALPLYGYSKLAGELLCGQYCEEHKVDCRILRLFSIFGPGEALTSGRSFTDFLRQTLETNTIQVTGPGTQIRSYCYLSDFVSGLLYVLLRGENTVYNVGNEDNTCSIFELAKQIAAVHGSTNVIGPFSKSASIDSFVPDTSKLRALGWQPRVNLHTCIKRCMDSYQ